MDERTQLEQAIKLQESLRGIVDDSIINAAVTALRRQLEGMQKAHPTQAERKQATILFATVTGYNALSAAIDAEDVNEFMNTLWRRLDAIIAGHGGYIDKHMGDSVMAVWGAQVAREDDPERAIHAALAMLQDIASNWFESILPLKGLPGLTLPAGFESETQISLRIGIHTGAVLMGGLGTTGEFTAVGDTVNTAKRLESAAPLGGVMISHDTFRHVRGVFDMHALDPITLKGKAEPLHVYTVHRAKPRAFRLPTRGVQGIETHMIGRQADMDLLHAAVQRAADEGKGCLMLVTGEAGVGKSRLVYEFQNWLDLHPILVRFYQGRARQETQGQPYALLRDLFSARFGIQENDPGEVIWEKMERGIADIAAPEPVLHQNKSQAHFIGQLLGFDFSASPYLQGALSDVKQMHDRALIYLEDYFQEMAAQRPAVIVLEDIHWADDSSLEVVEQLGRQAARQPMLIICLARPILFERRPQWGKSHPCLTTLTLQPLSTPESRQLVMDILRKTEHVPDALRELVVGGAEGNPFFIEELIKLLIEDGVIVTGAEQWHVEPNRLAQIRIPQTLTSLLQARIDSLTQSERTTLQQAATVGRIFWDQAVFSVEAPRPNAPPADESARQSEQASALDSLCHKELIFKQPLSLFAGANEYSFKHALLHNVTYESVLKRTRRQYHSRVANWLMMRQPSGPMQKVDDQPADAAPGPDVLAQPAQHPGQVFAGLVADHLEKAGRTIEAIAYLDQAGEEAARRYANSEAIAYFNRALALLPEKDLPARYELLLQRQAAHNLLGNSPASQADLELLRAIAAEMGDTRRQALVALHQMKFNNRGDLPATLEIAPAALDLARAAKDLECEAEILFTWGWALCQQGHTEASQPQVERALALAQQAGLVRLEGNCLRTLGILHGQRGDAQQMFDYYRRALEKHRQAGDRRGEFSALNNLGVNLSDGEQRVAYLEEALGIAQAIGERFYQAVALANLSNQDWARGSFERAVERCQLATQLAQDIQALMLASGSLETSADYAFALGNYEASLELNDRALKMAQQNDLVSSEVTAVVQQVYLGAALGEHAALRQSCAQLLGMWEKVEQVLAKGLALRALSWAYSSLEEYDQALEYSRQALEFLGEHPNVLLPSPTWKQHGNALAATGNLPEARAAYHKALETCLPWQDQPCEHLLRGMEARAGLARLALQYDDLPEALAQVEHILEMAHRPLPGCAKGAPGSLCPPHLFELSEESARIYLACYQALQAAGDGRAAALLADAQAMLQARAGKISSPERCRSYLHNVPEHSLLLP